MCAAGSLPVGEGMPPVSFTQRRIRGRLMPCMLSGPPNCRRRCGAPRMSIQRMQLLSGAPASSTGTVPSLCVLQQTAATSAAGPSWRASSRRVAATTRPPPVVRPLLRAAARQHEQLDGLELPGGHSPVDRR